jgi:hypothetical protein
VTSTRDHGRRAPALRHRRLRWAARAILLAVGWGSTVTCATYQIFSDCVAPSSQCPDLGAADQTAVLFLVGDAGSKEFDRNPVMQHMNSAVRALDQQGVPTRVLFLGDNVYEEGVRDGHPEDLRLLGAQVEVVVGTSAKGIFLAGNHDWGNTTRAHGLARLVNEERALGVFSAEGANVVLAPRAGCPGPKLENLETSSGDVVATLVLLDTPWWMREPLTDPRCGSTTREEVIRELEGVLRDAPDVLLVVAAHHPLRTGGPHGGHGGSLRRLANRVGLIREDLNAPRYQRLIDDLSEVFAGTSRSIIYAAGHDHSLQVIEESRGDASVLHLVSGSGSKVTGARPIDGSRFAAGMPGYMRLDFRSGDRVQLEVIGQCVEEALLANICRRASTDRFQSVYRARVR